MSEMQGELESVFPERPVEPRVFVEDVIPALFAGVELSAEDRAAELLLGVSLVGAGGGEWTLHFVEGELGIGSRLRPDCDLTLVQTVEDWRSALWEGRPGIVSDLVRVAFRGVGLADVGEPDSLASGLVGLSSGGPPDPATVAELRSLRGCIEIRFAGTSSPGADWRLAIVLGPGPVPAQPDATITLDEAEAEAMRQGTLHPLDALMTGRLRLEGDLGLVLQIQALALRASFAR